MFQLYANAQVPFNQNFGTSANLLEGLARAVAQLQLLRAQMISGRAREQQHFASAAEPALQHSKELLETAVAWGVGRPALLKFMHSLH